MRAVIVLALLVPILPQVAGEAPVPERWVIGYEGDLFPTPNGWTLIRDEPALGWASFWAPPDARERAMSIPNALWAQPDVLRHTLFTPNDPRWSAAYNVRQIGANVAWDSTFGTTSVGMCIIDSGVRYTHEDIAGPRYLGGYDFANNDPDPWDDQGHGTAVSALAIAGLNNGKGIPGIAQVTHRHAKFITPAGTGASSDASAGIRWCADQGVHVISMSFGSRSAGVEPSAIAYAKARNIVMVAGSGNDGCDDCVLYPAAYADVIAVGCTDSGKNLCSFSSRGPQVELAAPGRYTPTADFTGDAAYDDVSGTSASTPHVAAVAALVKSATPSWTAADIRTVMASNAEDRGAPGRDTSFGHGIVRADRVVGNSAPVVVEAGCRAAPVAAASLIPCRFRADDGSLGVAYTVDWGDGSPTTRIPSSGTTSPGQTVEAQHAWPAAGSYTVTVTATDNHPAPLSHTVTFSQAVQINTAPPAPGLSCAPALALIAETVACSLTVADDSGGVRYELDFGDGNTATHPSTSVVDPSVPSQATHVWTAAGTYTVTAYAVDDSGLPGPTASTQVRVVPCRLYASSTLTAGAGGVYVLGRTGTAVTIPSACGNMGFSLHGSSSFDNFDVCWLSPTATLRCDQRPGSDTGTVPAGATSARITYRQGLGGAFHLNIPDVPPPPPPVPATLRDDDGEMDTEFAVEWIDTTAQKRFQVPGFIPGVEASQATLEIYARANGCEFIWGPIVVLIDDVAFHSFDPCAVAPETTMGWVAIDVPIGLLTPNAVHRFKLVKPWGPPGYGDIILGVDSDTNTGRSTMSDLFNTRPGELMWQLRIS